MMSLTLTMQDTRASEEFAVSHLPGAIHVDPDQEHSLTSLSIAPESTGIIYSIHVIDSTLTTILILMTHVRTCVSPMLTLRSPAVVCYCSVGYRSSNVACKLRSSSSGLSSSSSSSSSQLYNLEGGVFQWSSEGRGLVDALGHPTTLVHPYSSFWGRLLPSEVRARI